MHEFVRDKVRYVRDIRGVETLSTPLRTLENHSGDCDDKATLASALLEAIGFRTRLTAWGRPGRFSHVLCEVRFNDKWLTVETTESVGLGWKPRMGYRMIAHV